MKKVDSSFFDRINDGEPFWVALPAKVIRQRGIGLLVDTMSAGGIMELNQKDLKRHNQKFHGDGKEKHNVSTSRDKK